MSDFNPDAFLKETAPQARVFDPDQFLTETDPSIVEEASGSQSTMRKVSGALKTGLGAVLRGIDWVGHIGQPAKAKQLVENLRQMPSHEDWRDIPPQAQIGLGMNPAAASSAGGAGFVDAATSPMSYVGLLSKIPAAAAAVQKVASLPKAGVTSLASELSGISRPALEMASSKAGRTALQQAAGQQGRIASDLVDAIDQFETHIPEAAQVQKAVKQMSGVDISPAIKALEDAKPKSITGALSPEQKTVAGKIDQYIEFLKGGKDKGAQLMYPAEDALSLRRVLDSPIDYTTGVPNPKEVQGALFSARQALKNSLLDAAKVSGNAEYKSAMSAWAKKLDVLDDVKNAALGSGSDYSKQARATFFVNSLFGKGVTAGQKQELVQKLDQVFGSNFLEQSKNARYAAELGEGGKAAFLPVQHTGRAALGATVGHYLGDLMGHGTAGGVVGGGLAALSSPAIATRVAIPLASLPPHIAQFLMRTPVTAALPVAGEAAMPPNAIPFPLRKVAAESPAMIPAIQAAAMARGNQ